MTLQLKMMAIIILLLSFSFASKTVKKKGETTPCKTTEEILKEIEDKKQGEKKTAVAEQALKDLDKPKSLGSGGCKAK